MTGVPVWGELAMWRRVIEQQLEEACGTVIGESDHPARRALAVRQAQAWFRSNGRDFQTVCLLADLDPARVRRVALAVIAEAEGAASTAGNPGRRPDQCRG